jgi:tetratricopeptide (TPR) repeat protein
MAEPGLDWIERALAADPQNAELRFGRACALEDLGRTDDAKRAYLAVLQCDASHFGAINNLATMLFAAGLCREAAVLFAEAVKRHPHNVAGYINLANTYFDLGEYSAARDAYEAALALEPDRQAAHQGLGNALTRLGQDERAGEHFARAFLERPVFVEPYNGAADPIRVLTLFDTSIGNVDTRRFIDPRSMLETKIAVPFFDSSQTLPQHDTILNAIGDADRCEDALARAARIVARAGTPVINHPEHVRATGRTQIGRYGAIAGVVVPATAALSRTILSSDRGTSAVRDAGFTFPLLIRAPGYHAGEHFRMLQDPRELRDAALRLPGEDALVIEYIDARDAAGAFRKYRVVIVDGRIFPLHLAISDNWNVHYFSAGMADRADRRAEDAGFLNDMPATLGRDAMRALESIRAMLALDFGGIDFGLDRHGRVLLFEANATMTVPWPDSDARWDYRRPHVARIHEAMRRLIPRC